MQNYSRSIKKSIPYVVLLSIISMDIMIFAGIINVFFSDNETIIAGVIAFCGAIIGGTITLMGVQLSIQHNMEMKSIEGLPNKINHIESALRKLNKIIKVNLVFDPRYKTARFISITPIVELVLLSRFNEFTEELPNTLKENFIYIDADAYQMYLGFRNKIEQLGMKLENEVEIMIDDFNKEPKDSVGWSFAFGKLEKIKQMKKPNHLQSGSTAEKFIVLNNALLQMDREFSFESEMIYKDLYIQLMLKHKELIKQLDY